jgi:hypothetical protein
VCTVKNSWWCTEELSKTCRVFSKNEFGKLVHVVGFIVRIYHDARSPERQFITMNSHLNVNLSQCTVTWTSIYHDTRSPKRQFIMMHGHLNVSLSQCTVTWTSIYHDARSPERQFITMHGHLNVKNLQNAKICCRFFSIGFHSSDRRQYCGSLLWDLGVISLIINHKGAPSYHVMGEGGQMVLCASVTHHALHMS